jgi:hypothetical protein
MDRHDHPHTHSTYSLGQLASHLKSWHEPGDNPDVWEAHEHFLTVKASYNDAARIDVHPWAMETLRGAPVIFAGMEGCLKADAMLSAILRDRLDASVYSFPSVTLGKCPELPRFADEFLQGKTVIAVLDADWADPSKEGAVENQGRIYQARLLALNVPKVHLAAPPLDSGQKGVDDFLGIGEGNLSELVCIDVQAPELEAIEQWIMSNSPIVRFSAVRKAAHILRSMAVFSGSSKALSVTLSCMANVMDIPVQTVSDHLARFQQWGAVEVDGELDTGPSWFGGFDWEHRPTIRLIPDVMQATVLPERELIDVLGPSFFGRS